MNPCAAPHPGAAAPDEDCERGLRDTHHRVKNNLHGLAGLLRQTMRRRPQTDATTANTVAGQLHALAQVHGQQMRTPGTILLCDLVVGLLADLSALHEAPLPVMRSGTAPVRIGEADAVSVALIVAELAANAITHAQPAGAARAALACNATGAELIISNPGRLPAGCTLDQIAPSTWGLGLAKSLLPRRGAALALDQAGGDVVATLRLTPPTVHLDTQPVA